MSLTHFRPQKRTKIVATLGPASSDKKILTAMIKAGLNTARLNFSHGDHDSHAKTIAILRELSESLNCPIAIMGDLRGPRIRVGEIENGSVALKTGQTFKLVPDTCLGNADRVSMSYPKLARDVSPGSRILLDDGSIEVAVTRILSGDTIEGTIVRGGVLSSRRGINVPGIHLNIPPLTEKDLIDIDFAVAQELDYLALSFVQSASDVQTLKTILRAKRSDIEVVAKIEMSGGLADIHAIVEEADGIMVARGDMALEMSYEEVPVAQKRIIAICRQHAVPVITATQMLESMITASKPTRAEVTDVANAVFDGTDALMLSAETAIGQYPLEVIQTMTRVAARAERAWLDDEVPCLPEIEPDPSVGEIISLSSAMAAESLDSATIVTYTRSGRTARRISRFRPSAPILVLTPNKRTYQKLVLSWGVNPILIDDLDNTDLMTKTAIKHAKSLGLADPGDHVIVTAGNPAGPPGNTNILRVETVETDS
ncbi:MAG: pyruvate kinase [Chloroflexota bacterium]